jgi:NADH dehydrogenase [ubiquinone] 1 alpha subcomplex assembly factor 7
MTALGQHFARRIRATGPMSVADFMDEASAHYYAARDPFGRDGDFITAPEVSQVFGELIGAWCAASWEGIGRPDPVLLVELGPGRGTMMADILRAARGAPDFARAVRLHLVERSPSLRALQAERLSARAPVWHDGIATLPPGPMLLVANEFLDALPIRQFQRAGTAWHERRIGLGPDGESLVYALDPAFNPLARDLPPAPENAIAELCPRALALGAALGARLARDGGAALFVDYGYHPRACGDTLQAVRRHRPQAVLDEPGSADLTAHVDFDSFAASARAAGAAIFGPVPQGAFLARLGIAARETALLQRATPAQADIIRSGCRRLIDPAEMGELFKVMALAHPAAALEGFA